jgi:pSer/pThr/pTyr-binding forkhead associated (FHA) protein
MLQLKILSGKQAGAVWNARRFPVRIGRAADSDLRLEEEGVWERHLALDFDPAEGVVLSALPDALASVNGEPLQQTILHNGDLIELGSLRLQFWLSETRQRGLRFREALTWLGITAVAALQVALIYWVLP